MGVFVNYIPLPFAGLNNIPTTILTANTNQLVVNGIMVCNYLKQDMRFNLKKHRAQATPVEIFYIVNFEVKAGQSVDILEETNIKEILLEYDNTVTPAISDSLICYSNGYTQVFDCEVTYTQLNELPMS